MTNRLQQHFSRIRPGAPSAALMLTLVLALGITAAQSAHAQTFTLLHSFAGPPDDGAYSYTGLAQDKAGNLYGTTGYGGSSYYFGVVFEVDTSGTETVLYNFNGATAGANPFAGLLQDNAGNFYGTTGSGGAFGYGVVYKLDSSGKETVLHSFSANLTDGQNPYGDGLIQDKKGNLYGTTPYGGIDNLGTVYEVDARRKEKVLHVFAGGSNDGASPFYTNLLMDKGYLYGVTNYGGTSDVGVVYKLSKGGKLTVLHSFTGGAADGCYPYGTPVMDSEGNLYGTTAQCGADGEGVVWKLSKTGGTWTETVLYDFGAGGSTDAAYPYAGVIMDAQGNLYGQTYEGGTSGYGTVYELSGNTLKLLHSFALTDGAYPYGGGVIMDAQGNLYGNTYYGGSSIDGTVWKITP